MNSLRSFILFAAILFWSCSEDEPLKLGYGNGELDQLILERVEQDNIPSVAAAIVKNDSIAWRNTFGYEDRAAKEIPNGETIYGLASISKTFVALAAMQLYEQGLIDLDGDINQYLDFSVRNPRFPLIPITTRMLLTHTSGLAWPLYEENPRFYSRYNIGEGPKLGEEVEQYVVPGGTYYSSRIWEETVPGDQFQYSNIGIALLGYVVESVSGIDFADYCKQYIFQPLQMGNTGFRSKELAADNLALLYHNGAIIEEYESPFYPAGLLRSSLNDLSHYVIAMINGGAFEGNRIIDATTVDEMLSIQLPEGGLYEGGMAFGWQWLDDRWVGHLGGSWGTSTSMDINLQDGAAVIILSNANEVEAVYPGGFIYERLHFEAGEF